MADETMSVRTYMECYDCESRKSMRKLGQIQKQEGGVSAFVVKHFDTFWSHSLNLSDQFPSKSLITVANRIGVFIL